MNSSLLIPALTAIASLAGVIISSIVNFLISKKVFDRQTKKELKEKRYQLYCKVLVENRNRSIYKTNNPRENISIEAYIKSVHLLLMKNFYILSKDIKEKVINIESFLWENDLEEEFPESELFDENNEEIRKEIYEMLNLILDELGANCNLPALN